MPAAAVIPAPIAYIKVVAVKKLVVGFLGTCGFGTSINEAWTHRSAAKAYLRVGFPRGCFTLRKLECFRQAWPGYASME